MATQKFLDALNKHITKSLKKKITGPPQIWTVGSDADQHVSLSLKERISLSVNKEGLSYQFREFVIARMPLDHRCLRSIDMIIPVLNIKKQSIPGIATFGTCIPFTVPETFVLRSTILGGKNLVPYNLAVHQKLDMKTIVNGNMIECEAINRINADKKLCKKLKGNILCILSAGFKQYHIQVSAIDGAFNYPMGMFSIVPFHGNSLIFSVDSGEVNRARGNSPYYPLSDRLNAIAGVANYIARYPEKGEEVGEMDIDKDTAILLSNFVKEFD